VTVLTHERCARRSCRVHGNGWGRERAWCSCACGGNASTSSSAWRAHRRCKSPRSVPPPPSAHSEVLSPRSMPASPACGVVRPQLPSWHRSLTPKPFSLCASVSRCLCSPPCVRVLSIKRRRRGRLGFLWCGWMWVGLLTQLPWRFETLKQLIIKPFPTK